MPDLEGVLFCDGCGVEIVGAPVFVEGQMHCCLDCAQLGDCDCALVLDDGRGDHLNLILPPLESPAALTPDHLS